MFAQKLVKTSEHYVPEKTELEELTLLKIVSLELNHAVFMKLLQEQFY